MRRGGIAEFDDDRRDRAVAGLGQFERIDPAGVEFAVVVPEGFDKGASETLVLLPAGGNRFHVLDLVGNGDVKASFVVFEIVSVPVKRYKTVGLVVRDHGAGNVIKLFVFIIPKHQNIVSFSQELVAQHI